MTFSTLARLPAGLVADEISFSAFTGRYNLWKVKRTADGRFNSANPMNARWAPLGHPMENGSPSHRIEAEMRCMIFTRFPVTAVRSLTSLTHQTSPKRTRHGHLTDNHWLCFISPKHRHPPTSRCSIGTGTPSVTSPRKRARTIRRST